MTTTAEQDRIEAASARYLAALHGVQCAIGYEMERGLSHKTDPKHLRVGVDSAHVTDRALAELLMIKGVITHVEYCEALADAAERELQQYRRAYPLITFV